MGSACKLRFTQSTRGFDDRHFRWPHFALVTLVVAASTLQTPVTSCGDDVSAKPPASGNIATGNWPHFLGPAHTGVSAETGLLTKWPATGPEVLWSKTVGEGYSAPSILGDRLVLHHRLRKDDRVECFAAGTGESLWTYDYPTAFRDPFGYSGGPRATPLLTATHCYTFGAQGKLLCLDLETGKLVWEHNCDAKWKVPDHFFGYGCTPVLFEGTLFVLVGGQPNSGVVAFDANTGKVLWEAVGKATWDGVKPGKTGALYRWTGDEMVVSYSSPLVTTIHGQPRLLCLVRHGLVGLDPATGETQFKYWFRSTKHESVNAARPVVVGNQILLSAAYEAGSVLLDVAADGKTVTPVWENRRTLATHWSTPIALNGFVYGFSGRHENEAKFQCAEWATGKVIWETTGYDGELSDFEVGGRPGSSQSTMKDKRTGKLVPWPFYGRGSKIAVDGHFLVLGERGTLALVPISSQEFRETSRASFPKISYPSWTAPVLSRGRLYLRSDEGLVCLKVSAED